MKRLKIKYLAHIAYAVLFFSHALFSQQLNVEGLSVIRGRLDLSHNQDLSTINIGLGAGAFSTYTASRNNTFIGYLSGALNSNGNKNSFYGSESGVANKGGFNNVAVGFQAMNVNTTGYGNTAIGTFAMGKNKTGNFNTAVGDAAATCLNADDLDNTTCIGVGAGTLQLASNMVEIGNSSISWIGGQVGWSTYSDNRIKNTVRENVPGLAFINRLRPVTYHLDIRKQNEMSKSGIDLGDWREKYLIEETPMTGFIAQEVEEAAQAIDYNFSGVHHSTDEVGIYSLRYAEFVVPLVKAVQELSQKCEDLLGQNEVLEERTIAYEDRLLQVQLELNRYISASAGHERSKSEANLSLPTRKSTKDDDTRSGSFSQVK